MTILETNLLDVLEFDLSTKGVGFKLVWIRVRLQWTHSAQPTPYLLAETRRSRVIWMRGMPTVRYKSDGYKPPVWTRV
jgi:hypothetical protein